MADDVHIDIELDSDDAQATRQFDRLAGIMADRFAAVAPEIGRELGRGLAQGLRRANVGDQAFEPFVRGAERAVREAREVEGRTERLAEGFTRMGEAGRRATRTINVDELNTDLKALSDRVEASRATLADLGARPNLFAQIDRELELVLRRQREFNENLETISRDPSLFEGYQESFRQSRRVISSELDAALRLLINFKEDQREVSTALQREQDRASRERVAGIRQASSAFVVAEQGANAQRLAETRIAGQRLIQQERITSRTRIEILRFTFRQIQILERGIAGAFRASGAVALAAARTTQAAVARIGSLFRRSNRELNDGLNGALIARERTLDRSFDRQTARMRGSLAEQSVLLNRFERQASTGVLGAVTGRSRLGGLFGAGIGVGGGFLLARQLREGFEESVNLTESLNAVRQITGEASAEIEKFAETSVESLFLTQSAALEAAVGFASFGKSAGLGGAELADFSNTLTQLATDLASFRNTSVEQAITSLTAALAGEAEPIRRNYSVLLNEATLQQRAFTEGITDTVRKLQPQERVLAAYAEILAQTTDAQGDAARTSRDFANASKQLGAGITTLFAALADKVIPLATTIVNVLNPAVVGLTNFLSGDTSPALRVFRDALIGAGIALSALLAARVAAEGVQFLGLALRGAVTPLGLLIVGVAAAGAAIRVFSQRSERFASIVEGVAGSLRDLVGRGLVLVGRGFTVLVDLISNQVLPAIVAFADVIGGPLIRGLEIAIGFIITIAIPAFARLATLLANNIVPALELVGRFLGGTVVPALRNFGVAAIAVLSAVVRFLDPAISGFVRLGEAVANAFVTGDLSGILDGLRAVAVGIGAVFANLGVLLFQTLRPQVERAVRFLSQAFDRIDFGAIASRILEVVRLVGFVLGSIVSDPRLLLALEAIAAAAIAVGAKFIQGFAQGVISNLPELTRLIGGQLRTAIAAAFEFAFDNPAVIGQIILAALAARALLSAYTRAGEAGGGSMVRGFARGVARSPGQIVQAFSGLFGGTGAIGRAIERDAIRTAENFQRQFSRTIRNFRRLGFDTSGLLNTEPDERALQRLNESFAETTGRIGETRAAARLFQQRTVEAVRGVRVGVGELARAITPGLSGSLTRARAGFSEAFTAISDGFARLREQGKLTGAGLGNAVLAGFGAVIAGQQLGQGNTTLGLAGILGSALTAGLATGIPLVGVAVGAIGLLTAAFTENDAAARAAAAGVDRYAGAVRDAATIAEVVAGFSGEVADDLLGLSETAQSVLASASFDVSQFVQAALEGSTATAAINEGFRGLDFQAAFGDLKEGREITDALTAAFNSLQGGLRENALREQILTGATAALTREQEKVAESTTDATDAGLDFASVLERIAAAIGVSVAELADLANFDIGSIFDLDSIFNFGDDFRLGEVLRDATFNTRVAALEALQNARRISAAMRSSFDDGGDAAQAAAEKVDLISVAVRELDQQRTTRVRAQIEAIRGDLDRAKNAADQARDSLTSFISGRYADTAQASVDQLIGQVGSIGSEIEDALLQGGTRGEARLRSAVGGFEQSLAQIIQAGFEDGLRTQGEFRQLLAPLLAALDEEVGDSAGRILSTNDFEFGITGRAGDSLRDSLNRALAGKQIEVRAGTLINAEAEVNRLEALLNAQEAKLDVEVTFSAEQIRDALAAAGATAAQLADVNPAAVVAAQQTPIVAAVASTGALAGGGVTTSPRIEVTQTNQTDITVSGARGPEATAAEIAKRDRAAATGRLVDLGIIR